MVVIDPPYKCLQVGFFKALATYNETHSLFGEGPRYITCLHNVLNDLGLPGFSVDEKKR